MERRVAPTWSFNLLALENRPLASFRSLNYEMMRFLPAWNSSPISGAFLNNYIAWQLRCQVGESKLVLKRGWLFMSLHCIAFSDNPESRPKHARMWAHAKTLAKPPWHSIRANAARAVLRGHSRRGI